MNRNYCKKTAAGILSLSLVLSSIGLTSNSKTYAETKNGVTINEICAKNNVHSAPDGNFYDWIELYNPTNSSIDISGWGLSDKEAEPFQYTFASGTTIGAKQRLIVYCDSDAAKTKLLGFFAVYVCVSSWKSTETPPSPLKFDGVD